VAIEAPPSAKGKVPCTEAVVATTPQRKDPAGGGVLGCSSVISVWLGLVHAGSACTKSGQQSGVLFLHSKQKLIVGKRGDREPLRLRDQRCADVDRTLRSADA